jgi:RNA polymerase sigma factor (sigma-70 family)
MAVEGANGKPHRQDDGNPRHQDSGEWVRSAHELYARSLLRYCHHLTRNTELAQEIVQETFLRLCRQSEPIGEPRLKCWLFAVCRNQAIDSSRRNQRMNAIAINDFHALDTAATPFDQLAASEAKQHVLDLIEELPANQQELLRLKFQAGMTYKEIEEVTGLSTNYIGVLLHTAISKLRVRLNPGQSLSSGD